MWAIDERDFDVFLCGRQMMVNAFADGLMVARGMYEQR